MDYCSLIWSPYLLNIKFMLPGYCNFICYPLTCIHWACIYGLLQFHLLKSIHPLLCMVWGCMAQAISTFSLKLFIKFSLTSLRCTSASWLPSPSSLDPSLYLMYITSFSSIKKKGKKEKRENYLVNWWELRASRPCVTCCSCTLPFLW